VNHLQSRIRNSGVMVMILNYLEPESFMRFEKLSKKFYYDHLPSVIQDRKKMQTARILDENQQRLIEQKVGGKVNLIHYGNKMLFNRDKFFKKTQQINKFVIVFKSDLN